MQPPRSLFFLLFTLSGFSGLIYESIWTHYLKLFLGHAAYAQTLVLGIFMGGMALGAWITGRVGQRISNPLRGYAIVELAIGMLAIAFHAIFIAVTDWAFASAIPAVGDPTLVGLMKWCIAALLILPASILLGATFPLMSTGIMRRFRDERGDCLPILYFTNSLGAAIGVLVSGFVLIGWVGLPGTILSAGLMNIALALMVWLLTSGDKPAVEPPAEHMVTGMRLAQPMSRLSRLMYIAAFMTGAASFMFEIAWMRMLSLVIGSATHSFEVMLSAFILGIALGGLALSALGRHFASSARLLGHVLAAKCFLALLAVASFPWLMDLFQWLFHALAKTPNGYAIYLVSSYGLSGLMMLPAAFCAGMTLPLATRVLLESNAGEKAVGQIYAANTLGAIAGTFAATHIGMELLGVKGITGAGALMELAVGVAVLLAAGAIRARLLLWPALPALLAFPAYAAALDLNQLKLASGVYRFGRFLTEETSRIHYYKDGKTATIAVVETNGYLGIHTNGKADAAISLKPEQPPSPDEHTMQLAAVLPYLYRPNATSIANIGFGSGLTTHVALGNPAVKVVDSIEIESAMIEGARKYGNINRRAYEDPRSAIHIEDAKTFFAARGARYDLIISEPSNPWVSGVAALFSEEFYARIKGHLNKDGLLVQWVQLYDSQPYIVASIVKALGRHFSDYAVFTTNGSDAIIVATPSGSMPPLTGDPFQIPAWRDELTRLGYTNVKDFRLLSLGSRRTIGAALERYGVPPNSDYYPFVDGHAQRERYLGSAGHREFIAFSEGFVPILALLDGETLPGTAELAGKRPTDASRVPITLSIERSLEAHDIAIALREPQRIPELPLSPRRLELFMLLQSLKSTCTPMQAAVWTAALDELARGMSGAMDAREVVAAFDLAQTGACQRSLLPVDRKRIEFLRAVLARSPQDIVDSAQGLLSALPPDPRFLELRKAALFSMMAAKLAQGKREDASALVARNPSEALWQESLLARALSAHALARPAAAK